MRILLTGASGSMGHYLARYIQSLNEGHEVWGLGRRLAGETRLTGLDRYISCDLTGSGVSELLATHQFDLVFHLAGVANVRQSFDDAHIFINNVQGTVNLFDALKGQRSWPKVVLCSTSEVYGNVPAELNPIREGQGYAPVNPYAASKLTQEIIAETYQRIYGFPLIITRAFGYINPLRKDLVATALVKQIVDIEVGLKEPPCGVVDAKAVVHGDLTPVRSFADARDIAAAYWLAGTRCAAGVYNIGSEQPCSIERLLGLIETQFSFRPVRRQLEQLVRPTDIFTCYPNTSKFRAVTGWRPKFSLEESVAWLCKELSLDYLE